MNRRGFLAASAAAITGVYCSARADGQMSQPSDDDIVDAGPLTQFAADGVFDQFREQGFFVIRRDKKLFVLSSVCTHKGCKVRAQEDRSFMCKCHKSRFSPDGAVLNGPATRKLPRLAVKESAEGHVLVNLKRPIEATT